MLSKILIKVLNVHSGPESLEFAGFHAQLVLCINLALLYIKMKFSRSREDYNSFS